MSVLTNEERRLVKLLGKDPGFAVEVGAADGQFTSPTLVLEKLHEWNVICVEPNPLYAAHARATRMHVVEAAAADFIANDHPFTLCNVHPECRLHEMQGGSSLVVQREHLERLGWTPKGERMIEVAVRTLSSILADALWDRLDFLSVDTEGTEDMVLHGLDFDRWRPKVICVENWPGINKTDHILHPLGYRRIERVMGNYTDWYVDHHR